MLQNEFPLDRFLKFWFKTLLSYCKMFQLAPGDAHLIFDGEWLADFVRGAPISFSKNSDRNRKT